MEYGQIKLICGWVHEEAKEAVHEEFVEGLGHVSEKVGSVCSQKQFVNERNNVQTKLIRSQND